MQQPLPGISRAAGVEDHDEDQMNNLRSSGGRSSALSRNTQLSPEDRLIFQECQREAFYYRSVPLSLALGGAVMLAVRKGILSASPRFGYWPKTVAGVTIGYLFGKASYLSTCQDKFLQQAPNSEISKAIRKARGGVYEISAVEEDQGTEEFNTNSFMDSSIPSANEDKPSFEQRGLRQDGGGTLSYDQLRAQHRQRSQTQSPYSSPSALTGIQPSMPIGSSKVGSPPSYSSSETADETTLSSRRRPTTNKYGDEVYDE